MGWWSRLRGRPSKSEGHSLFGEEGTGTRFELLFASPEQLATPTQFDAFAREGFRLNSVMRACVVELASSVAEPRLEVQVLNSQNQWEAVRRSRGPLSPAQRLQTLMQRPGGDADTKLTPYEWGEQGMADLAVYGNEFWRKRKDQRGFVVGLERVQAPYIQPERDGIADGGAARQRVKRVFVRRYSNQNLVTADTEASVPVDYDDLIHIKHYDPLDMFWGLPPCVAEIPLIDLDDKAIYYLRAFFKNAGTPQGILKTKGILTADGRRRIKDSWRQQHTGDGRHEIAVLDGDSDYTELGTRPDKLKLDNILDLTESRICAGFGVPPVLAGVRIGIMRATDTNYKNSRTSFWIETLSPIYEKRGQAMTQQLALDFDPSGETRLAYNLEEVADLQESEEVLHARAQKGWQEGLLTQNEARRMISLPPHEGGDIFHTRSSDGPAQKWGEEPKLAPKATGASAPGPGRPAPAKTQGTAPGTEASAVSHAPGLEAGPGAEPEATIN